jgi:hypothetical protein
MVALKKILKLTECLQNGGSSLKSHDETDLSGDLLSIVIICEISDGIHALICSISAKNSEIVN